MTADRHGPPWGLALAALAVAAALAPALAAAPPPPPCPSLGVEQLLGGKGCAEQRERDARLVLGGRSFTWQDYLGWGRELFIAGQVRRPPIGPAPSPLLSHVADYTCSRCHNDRREDPVLTRQDPEARYSYIVASPARSGLQMTQGTTLWGAVNRTAFYNGLYAAYHSLCVPLDSSYPDPSRLSCGPSKGVCGPGCRAMDPAVLADAIQVCGKYCSVGRYLTSWELAAMLTFFWDRQVELADVDLAPARKAQVAKVLTDPRAPAGKKEAARRELRGSFLQAAGETRRDAPPALPAAALTAAGTPEELPPALMRHLQQFGEPQGELMLPPTFRGILSAEARSLPGAARSPEVLRGRRLYALTCGHCHGPSPEGKPQIGGRGHRYLAGSQYLFYEVLENGTSQAANVPYMPEFPLERLSDRQARDLLLYLQSLAPAGGLLSPLP